MPSSFLFRLVKISIDSIIIGNIRDEVISYLAVHLGLNVSIV
jgi:hypothetical protein